MRGAANIFTSGPMPFVHLHTHSEYSLLDGANRIPELLDRVQALGMDSLAITDHGNLHGAWSFYAEAKARKIRPILGFEAYLAFGSRHAREKPSADAPGGAPYSHLVLLARNRIGYQNLIKLSSIGFLEGYYRRPRIDKEVLERHRDGLIGLAACLSGEIALYLRQGNYEAAKASAAWFAQTFGPDGFWLEVQNHGIPEEQIVTEGMFRIAAELGLPVAATNDAHYLRKEDAEAHDVLLAIGTGKDLDDPKRFRFFGQESYVKSEPEMRALFPDRPDVLAETARVAERCEFDFEKRYFLPQYPRPAEFASDQDLLVHLARQGAVERYGDPLPAPVLQRRGLHFGHLLAGLRQRDAERRPGGDQLRDPFDVAHFDPQRPCDVAERGAGFQGPERDDLAHRLAAVALARVLEYLAPPLETKVEVDVGHRDALGVQKPLEQQVELQGIDVRDAERVGDE